MSPADEDRLRPEERARDEAAEAAGVEPAELVEEHPPVATPQGRAYSIRAALAAARRTRRAARISLAAAGGALLLTVAIAAFVVIRDDGDGPAPIDPEDIVAEVSPSTVRVTADGPGLRSEGSGWVLDAEEGLIVTNFHVVGGGRDFDVALDGDFRSAELVAAAPCDDLALLRTEETDGLRTLPLADADEVDQGEAVVALGYAANLSQGQDISSTAGIISVESSAQRIPAPDSPELEDLLQTDAPLNPGNSGGPLVNEDAELVGVNTAIVTQLGGQPIQSQGYAIGVERTREVVAELREGDSAGWFGTGLVVPPRNVLRRERIGGILATGAAPGTSGADEELEGALITSVEGRKLSSDIADYCDAVEDVESGDSVRMTVSPAPGEPLEQVSVQFE